VIERLDSLSIIHYFLENFLQLRIVILGSLILYLVGQTPLPIQKLKTVNCNKVMLKETCCKINLSKSFNQEVKKKVLHSIHWICFADIAYSQNAPSGHLPALVMADPYRVRSDQTFAPCDELFEVFVARQY